jgi:hypothetical protein
MIDENIEKAKTDVKKEIADIEKKVAYAKADAKADAEMAMADLGKRTAHIMK